MTALVTVILPLIVDQLEDISHQVAELVELKRNKEEQERKIRGLEGKTTYLIVLIY